jgi:hypothetical protein
MVLTQPAHTVSKKGGDCRIQFIFKSTKQPMLIVITIWFHKLRILSIPVVPSIRVLPLIQEST